MHGYVKLYRKTLASSIWQDPDLFRLWMFCLMKASHKERTVMVEKKEVELDPGQFYTGRFSLHQEFNNGVPPRKQVKDTTLWSWLKKLESMGNLDIKTYNKYSVVSIVNWSEYQDTLTTEPQQIDSKMTAKPQQIDTNKNVKNVKNVKKDKNVINTTEDSVDLIAQRFADLKTIQTGRPSHPSTEDYQAIVQIVVRGVSVSQTIELLEQCFKEFEERKPNGKITSFKYCESYILDRLEAEQKKEQILAKRRITSDQNNGRDTGSTPKQESLTNGQVGRFPRRKA
ncbi:hypothetical protein [Jeotgalibacillus soli]|uniref:DnaD domain-containing protein n=1 Tax=Jeotgalibacillus soli TaxID=889306 RepID=A0A0C2V9V0_9BACL|nr:hypothetical protein [Jeotgalibacillus soli]KIL45737.1 hypothetical protein KP78_20860 [Jeotgalibacillus soli]